jgi:hypothetical protein
MMPSLDKHIVELRREYAEWQSWLAVVGRPSLKCVASRPAAIFHWSRCGAGWQEQCLFCRYCAMTNDDALVSLVPEKGGSNSVIDAKPQAEFVVYFAP